MRHSRSMRRTVEKFENKWVLIRSSYKIIRKRQTSSKVTQKDEEPVKSGD